MIIEEMAALMAVVEALEALGVAYALGGSWVSAVHGVLRARLR
jgi:urea transporter